MSDMKKTEHKIYVKNSGKMGELEDNSVDLVVTSPPYPMIAMWDELFSAIDSDIGRSLKEDGKAAFELMHKELDKTWTELKRVVKSGGIVCINIGDATRTIGGSFKVYPNHARIVSKMVDLGFETLPEIIWHKPTNSPNKFMGSGMLPGGAYVTLEHEYILIFRKKGKRVFSEEEKVCRRESSYFWEERNEWFSDVWEFRGKRQKTNGESARERSAAYPCELPKRLILMFSQYGDTVLDPFLGTGTTTKAAILFGRNSVGYEIDGSLIESCKSGIIEDVKKHRNLNKKRLLEHLKFIQKRIDSGKEVKHMNERYNIPVMTAQETDIVLYDLLAAREGSNNCITAEYGELSATDCAEAVPLQRSQQKISNFS